ncbi:MAG: flagellar basal body-associated protein FliL [Sphingobium sp.]
MSDEPKARKKGGMKMLVLLVLAMGVGGVGAGGGLYAAGFFTPKETVPGDDPRKPVLVPAGENAEDVAKTRGGGQGGSGAAPGDRPGKGIDLPAPANPSAYQATYFQMQAPFTSNMTDTDAFAQISIAVSTYYDMRVIDAIRTHEMAIRSQVLMLLAQQPETMLATPEGKQALQAKIRTVINDALKQKTGYGGVDNVYFTNFVIQ